MDILKRQIIDILLITLGIIGLLISLFVFYQGFRFGFGLTVWLQLIILVTIASLLVLYILYKFQAINKHLLDLLTNCENKYQALSEAGKAGIWQVNSRGYSEYTNSSMRQFLEIESDEELKGVLFSDFFNNESKQLVIKEFASRLEGHSSTYELIIIGKNGTSRNVLVTGSPYFDSEGRIIGTLGIFIDLTEKLQTQAELIQSRENFKQLFELMPIPLALVATDGKLIDINKRLIEATGYTLEDIPDLDSCGLKAFPDAEYRTHSVQEWRNAMYRVYTEDNYINSTGYKITIKDGTECYMIIGVALQGKNILVSFIDITEQKLIEEALRKSEAQFRGITQNIPGMVFQSFARKDGEIGFNYISDSSMEYIGLYNTDIEGMFERFAAGIVEEDRVKFISSVLSSIASLTRWEYEGKYIKPDGIEIYLRGLSQPRQLNDGIVFDGIILDITKSKLAEKELADTKLLLDTALIQTPIPMVIVSAPDYIIRMTNSAAKELFGIDDESNYVGRSLLEINRTWQDYDEHGNAVSIAELPITLALQGIETKNKEYYVKRKDGTIRWESVSSSAVRNSTGDIVAAFLVFPDITERKLAVEKLKQMADLHKTILDTLTVGLTLIKNRKQVWINAAQCQMFGYNYKEQVGLETLMLYANIEDYNRVGVEGYGQLSKGEIYSVEIPMKKKNGSLFWCDVVGKALNPDDLSEGSIWVLQDINERKIAEQALIESEKWLKDIVESSPYSMTIQDLEGRYLLVNRSYTDSTGYLPEEVIGKTVNEIGIRIDYKTIDSIISELQSKGIIENLEIEMIGKSGKKNHLFYSAKIIQMKGNPVILSSTVDITDKKIMEQELEKYRQHLEQLVAERTSELAITNEELVSTNDDLLMQREELQSTLDKLNLAQQQLVESEKMASLGILAAGISHEINNPLNFIQGGVFGLKDYFETNLSEHLEQVQPLLYSLDEGVRRAAGIITSLNHFSRKTDSENEKCNIHEVIDNCLTMLQNTLKHRVEVEKTYTERAFILTGNDGKLHQAFLNILTNAQQSISGKGIITIKTEIEKRNIVITIIDNGCGISPENISKIFDPFFTTKDPGKGTGLGLSITYRIIKEHQGEINYKSKVNFGTTVTIKLPIVKI